MYEKQKLDVLGQPMYATILSESEEFHTFSNDICTRCGAKKPAESTEPSVPTEPEVPAVHEHADNDGDCKCDGADCTEVMHSTLTNGICNKCNIVINESEHTHVDENPKDNNCDLCPKALPHACVDAIEPLDGKCDVTNCGKPMTTVTETINSDEGVEPANLLQTSMVMIRPWRLLRTSGSSERFIKYDTNSAPVYDTSSPAVYETETKTTYYGWQTIDGATYYFDKNGKKVTGQQVIQGISYTFSSDGVRSGTIGIDVSKYQKNINWSKIKNAGINFVIIRCGYRGYGSGVLVQDEMFVSHITGAKAAGLRVGIYFFSQAINEAEAVEEASMAISLAKKYGINMPIAIDSEYANGGKGRADGLSKSDRTKITRAFCDTVKNSGYTPMVYASKSWFSNHLDVSKLSSYRIWVAHYAEKCGYTGNYHIWQNTDKGKVDGYSGYLDMNISSI